MREGPPLSTYQTEPPQSKRIDSNRMRRLSIAPYIDSVFVERRSIARTGLRAAPGKVFEHRQLLIEVDDPATAKRVRLALIEQVQIAASGRQSKGRMVHALGHSVGWRATLDRVSSRWGAQGYRSPTCARTEVCFAMRTF